MLESFNGLARQISDLEGGRELGQSALAPRSRYHALTTADLVDPVPFRRFARCEPG